MKGFFRFIASQAGRWTRIIAGLILILLGIFALSGTWQWVFIIVGIIPLAAGIFDWCVFAPLFGLPFIGGRLREAVKGSGEQEVKD